MGVLWPEYLCPGFEDVAEHGRRLGVAALFAGLKSQVVAGVERIGVI